MEAARWKNHRTAAIAAARRLSLGLASEESSSGGEAARRVAAWFEGARRALLACLASLFCLALAGCGTTKSQTATEQMLASDAVDRSVAKIDFSPLAGRAIYFDTTYIQAVKGAGFVNAEYIISSLRQQMFAHGCLLQEKQDQAEYVVEGRVGVLGLDDHEITYGVPASRLSGAAGVVPGSLPAVPELSLAKKNEQVGAAKVAVFAYERETRRPVWQSGIATTMSDADSVWFFGAGPFRRGSIYDGMRFAGSRVGVPRLFKHGDPETPRDHALVSYTEEGIFPAPVVNAAGREPVDAGDELPDEPKPEPPKKDEPPKAAEPPKQAEPPKPAEPKPAGPASPPPGPAAPPQQAPPQQAPSQPAPAQQAPAEVVPADLPNHSAAQPIPPARPARSAGVPPL